MTKRSLIQRSLAILALILVSVYLYMAGKSHTLILDTRMATVNGVEYKAPDSMDVKVNGAAPETMGRAERIMVTVQGARHSISMEPLSGTPEPVTRTIRVPVSMDMVIVSLPAMLKNAPESAWIRPFDAEADTVAAEVDPEDTGEKNQFFMSSDDPATDSAASGEAEKQP